MKSKILSIAAISVFALTLSASGAFADGPAIKPTKQAVMSGDKAEKSHCGKHRFKDKHGKRHEYKKGTAEQQAAKKGDKTSTNKL